MATADSVFYSEYKTQEEWILDIDSTMKEPESSKYTPVCIFKVPKSISDIMPEAYSPQVIGLGPYHYFRSDIFRTGLPYKIAAAKKAIQQFQLASFEELVSRLKNQFQDINACYFGILGLEEDTLFRVMAVDSLFLLELLDTHENYNLKDDSPWHLTQSLNNPMFRNAIVKDVMMLENQIPLFVLSQNFSTRSKPYKSLSQLLVSFCEARCPIVLDWSPYAKVDHELEHKHILDLMYGAITRELPTKPKDKDTEVTPNKEGEKDQNSVDDHLTILKQLRRCWTFLLQVFLEFCAKIIYWVTVPCNKIIVFFLFVLQQAGIQTNFSTDEKKVLIPSVAQLQKAGVKFQPSKLGGTWSIEFIKKEGIFILPVINLRPTSQVIMRNLVAYETLTQRGSFPFKRYTELMNAMVDTVEDVHILKDARIIKNTRKKLKDAEILELFNGMGKSMTAKDLTIEKAILRANYYYNNATNVRLGRVMKHVYASWKMLAFLGSIFLLFLTTLQTVCGFYKCPKW